MTKSQEELVPKPIHSNSSPVILNQTSLSTEIPTTTTTTTTTSQGGEKQQKAAAVKTRDHDSDAVAAAKRRRQDELLDSLAMQHLVEQEQKAASGVGGGGAPTMSIKSNFSEVVMNASGIADQSYSLDFSAQHTATNPSYSSYGTYESGPIESQRCAGGPATDAFYHDERRSQSGTTTYRDVPVIDEPPPSSCMYVPSTASFGLALRCASGARPNKSATASYNSYKSLKSGLDTANCEIKPVWVLTKVTRYVTRTIRRERIYV